MGFVGSSLTDERNIVVICLDTVREDYFNRHAEQLVSRADRVVSQCRAPSSWTVPSHASFFTGELPHNHDAHAYNTTFEHIKSENTFLDDLDHRTIGVSANPYASSSFGFASLFDEFVDIAPSVVFPEGMYLKDFTSDRDGVREYIDYTLQVLDHDHPFKSLVNGVGHISTQMIPDWAPRRTDDGGRAVTRAARKQTRSSSEPYFLFLNFMEAHAPFSSTLLFDRDYRTVPRGWSSDQIDIWEINTGNAEDYCEDIENYRQLYSASIEYLDRLITPFLDTLSDRSSYETTVIITADHGENLVFPEDDDLIEHKGSLTEGLLHVPLLIYNPPSGFELPNDEFFSLLDLGALVQRLTGESVSFEYTDIVPAELIGLGSANPQLSQEEGAYWDRTIRCGYRGTEKYLWDSSEESYLETVDPNRSCWRRREKVNVDIPQEIRSPFDTGIHSHKSERVVSTNTGISRGTTDRLEDLGYL